MSGRVEPLRWGLLSTARINDKILHAAAGSGLADVLAVASRSASVAEEYARSRDIGRGYGSYDALLEDDEVDAVYISLPNHLHVEWSVRALEAGKHVLCEKPLSARGAEADRAFAAAERSGRVLSEAFMWRHHPQTHRLRQLVTDGAVGKVRRLRARFGFQLEFRPSLVRRSASRLLRKGSASPPRRDVRLVPEYGGGALMDVGCYCVNALRLLGGEPLEVVDAHCQLGRTGVDLRFGGRLAHPDGVESSFECWLDGAYRAELEIDGTQGSLSAVDPYLLARTGIGLRRGDTVETIEISPVDPYRLELEDMAAAAAGEPPLLGRQDAVAQARVLEALLVSVDVGGD